MGAEAEELSKHPFGIVNVWRPIRGPVQDPPLALCDVRSFTDDDLIASDLVCAHVRGETSRVAYNPALVLPTLHAELLGRAGADALVEGCVAQVPSTSLRDRT